MGRYDCPLPNHQTRVELCELQRGVFVEGGVRVWRCPVQALGWVKDSGANFGIDSSIRPHLRMQDPADRQGSMAQGRSHSTHSLTRRSRTPKAGLAAE
jgi:hypothetical protein